MSPNNKIDLLKKNNVEYFEEDKMCQKRLRELKTLMRKELEKAKDLGRLDFPYARKTKYGPGKKFTGETEHETFQKALEEVLMEKLCEAEQLGDSYFG